MNWDRISEKCSEFNSSHFFKTGKHNKDAIKLLGKSLEIVFIQGELEKIVHAPIDQSESKYKNIIKTHFELINILFLCEAFLTSVIDLFIIYIIETKHGDLWNFQKNIYVSSLDDLKSVDVFHKIEFLKRHDYGFMKDLYPRQIRNAIAHANYLIKPDGSIVTYNNKGNPQKLISSEQLEKIIKNIFYFVIVLTQTSPEELEKMIEDLK